MHGWKSTKTLIFSIEKLLQNSWGSSRLKKLHHEQKGGNVLCALHFRAKQNGLVQINTEGKLMFHLALKLREQSHLWLQLGGGFTKHLFSWDTVSDCISANSLFFNAKETTLTWNSAQGQTPCFSWEAVIKTCELME